MIQTKRNSAQHGTAVIEGTMALLLFLVFWFAIWAGARLFNVQEAVTNAAREGARLSVAPLSGTGNLPTVTEVENEVNRFLQAVAIRQANTTVTVQPVIINIGGVQTEFTRVRVDTLFFFFNIPMFQVLQLPNLTLSGEALMRNETSP